MKNSILLIFLGILMSCSELKIKPKSEYIAEIRETEEAFNNMAAETGVKEAFLYFADAEAVLNRNNQIIKGKKAIADYFGNQTLHSVSLQWQPEYVDVSDDGTLGYTYGTFSFVAVDTSGQKIESSGVFHTVWKKQEDGSWRYVYD